MATIERAQFIQREQCIACQGVHLEELSGGRFDEGVVGRFIADDPWGDENPAPFLQGLKWSLVRCVDCGQKFHKNILNTQWNERRFSQWMSQGAIEEFEKNRKTPSSDFHKGVEYGAHILQLEYLTRNIRGPSPVRVLDFGCGYGEFLAMCALYGFTAVGVDRSSAKRSHGKFVHVFSEISELQKQEKFHALTLFEVLEHLDDPRDVLSQLAEFLADGGILILETPDCSDVVDIKTQNEYRLIHPLDHINAFSPDTLKNIAIQLGFVEVKKPVSIIGYDWSRIVRRIGKKILQPVMKPTTQLYFRKV